MRLGESVEWAAHCVVLMAGLPDGAVLPASRLAEFHGVPGPYLAKALQALTAAGIISSRPGRRGGYALAWPAEEISLLDVVLAVEGDTPIFACTEIRRRGPSAVADREYPPLCGIAGAMGRAERAWRDELARTTVAQLASGVARQAPRAAQAKAREWLTGVVR